MRLTADDVNITVEMMQPTRFQVHCHGIPSEEGVCLIVFETGGYAEIHLTAEQVVELRGKLADEEPEERT